MLLATTAIILPDVSLTVPCNTSSGITRQRLPLVQFGEGPPPASLATIGLTNGSRRPCGPKLRAEGLGFSAVLGAGLTCVTFGGAGGFAAPLACVGAAFLLSFVGFTAMTEGAFVASVFLVSVFFAAAFFVSVALAAFVSVALAATTGVGVPLAAAPAVPDPFTGSVAVFTGP